MAIKPNRMIYVTIDPKRSGDIHYVEDTTAAWRMWADRRSEIKRMLEKRFGGLVGAVELEMIRDCCEYLTTCEDERFFDECQRDGVAVYGIGLR